MRKQTLLRTSRFMFAHSMYATGHGKLMMQVIGVISNDLLMDIATTQSIYLHPTLSSPFHLGRDVDKADIPVVQHENLR